MEDDRIPAEFNPPESGDYKKETREAKISLRKNWRKVGPEVESEQGGKIILYETPSGTYLEITDSRGRTVSLEEVEEEK